MSFFVLGDGEIGITVWLLFDKVRVIRLNCH